jgi:hypothetical protein
MNTEEIMVALDFVLDHSDVMTAERGYSAPIPGDSTRLDAGCTWRYVKGVWGR